MSTRRYRPCGSDSCCYESDKAEFKKLQLERDQLAARVGELTGALESVLDELSNDSSVMGCDSRATADWFVDAAAVLCCGPQPAASLARHDAGLLRKPTDPHALNEAGWVLLDLADVIAKDPMGCKPHLDVVLRKYLDALADRIEQEADK